MPTNYEKLCALGIPLKRSSGQVKCKCPQCSDGRKPEHRNDPCLSVNIDTGQFQCHNCNWHGGVANDGSRAPQKQYVKPVWTNVTQLPNDVVQYFATRKISQQTLINKRIAMAWEWMPQTQKQEYCMLFPYVRNGELVNIKYRTSAKQFKMVKDAELILYNVDAIKDSIECLVVEGEPDTLSFEEAGYPYCVSVPNGASKGNNNLQYLDNCIGYFENKTKIYIGVDNDEPGRALQHELVRRLGAERCWIIDYGDCKDGNEYLVKYGAIALTDLLSKARAAHISGILEVSDITSAVYDLRENGLQPGLKVDIKSIDDYISFPDSYFTIVTGIPNHGKSPFLDFILERLVVLHNKKVAYCSPESEPTQLHLSGVISLITGKSFEKKFGIDKQITKEELAQALAYCQDHYYFISQEASESLNDLYLKKFTLDNVLALAKKLVFRYGINYLVIDPWNRLEHAKGNFWSETDYVSEQLDKVNSALKILGIHVFVIAHPTKLLKDKRTGQYEIPSLYSISGSAAFFSKPHMGWTSYRNFDLNEHWMVIQKMKHRHIGKIPNEDQVPKFYYDAVSGRFTPKGCQADHSNHLLTRPPALGYGVPQPEIFTTNDFNDAPLF